MSYKSLNFQQDFAPLSTAVNEVIIITGSLHASVTNVKTYKNIASGSAAIDLGGYFQTVYDSAPSSALSTPLFDITFGMTTASNYNVASTATSSQTEKIKIHRQMAALLLGNPDAKFTINSVEHKEAIFILFKRNLLKD